VKILFECAQDNNVLAVQGIAWMPPLGLFDEAFSKANLTECAQPLAPYVDFAVKSAKFGTSPAPI
jgi:hypothetical protein